MSLGAWIFLSVVVVFVVAPLLGGIYLHFRTKRLQKEVKDLFEKVLNDVGKGEQ